VLPLPVNPGEEGAIAPAALLPPLRIGFVGTATAAKGIDIFLDLARRLGARFGGRIAFHLVGRALPGSGPDRFAGLAEPVGTAQLPRAEFLRRLARLHYVLLPYQPGYYDLSASGALLDAVTWRKPVIALRVPITAAMFAAADQPIGVLCDDAAGLEEAVADIATRMDADRYAREVAAIERLRAARQPAALAARYAALVRAGFAELPLS
jgi:glycosyltransferase involved in cell wall biosynthesis